MPTKLDIFIQSESKKNIPDVKPGDIVKVYQKIPATLLAKGKSRAKEKKERIQVFEGIVIARKHGRELGATITVRRVIAGVGCEKILPLHSPTIEKIEIERSAKVRRAKLYYLREAKGKRARLKYKSQ